MRPPRLPALLLAVLATPPAFARADPPATRPAATAPAFGPLRPGRLLEAYGETLAGLNLSPPQMDQARAILRQTRESFRDRIVDPNLTPAQRADVIRSALAQLDQSIRGILTDEQRRQFEQRSQPMRERLREQLRIEAARPAPATRPATQPGDRPGAAIANRVERALAGLGLTDDQRNAIFDILDPARDHVDQIIATGQAAGAPTAEIERRVRAVVEENFGKVSNLLIQPQKDRFEVQFRADRPSNAPPLATPAPGSVVLRDGTAYLNGNASPTMTGEGDPTMSMSGGNRDTPRVADASRPRVDPPTSQPTIHLGDPMPSFTLTRLNGSSMNQRVFANHPGVLIFGSLTSPSFRDRAAKLQQLANSYGSGVLFVVVYTREMYPGVGDSADVPERNHDDHIEIAAHATAADRAAVARQAKQKLGLSMEVVPDSMDDRLTNAFGVPNGAAIFDAQGKLVAIEQWAEPFAIKRALDRLRGAAE